MSFCNPNKLTAQEKWSKIPHVIDSCWLCQNPPFFVSNLSKSGVVGIVNYVELIMLK